MGTDQVGTQKKGKGNTCKESNKRWIIWLVVVIAVVLFPVIVDRILTHKCYEILFQIGWLKKASIMEESDWFSFLGSYLGAIGTIIIGMIAYQQSHFLGVLQEQVNQMQKEMTEFQMHPIISVKGTKIEVRNDPNESVTIQNEIEDYYFSIYGKPCVCDEMRYIMIEILFEDKGIIPTIQCEIRSLIWDIAGHNYHIKLDETKQRLCTCDTIRIIIDDNDTFLNKNAFFEDWVIHRDNSHNGAFGYDKSILKLEVCFTNQKEYRQTYEFSYCIRSDQGLMFGSPFIKSIGGGKDETEQCDSSK